MSIQFDMKSNRTSLLDEDLILHSDDAVKDIYCIGNNYKLAFYDVDGNKNRVYKKFSYDRLKTLYDSKPMPATSYALYNSCFLKEKIGFGKLLIKMVSQATLDELGKKEFPEVFKKQKHRGLTIRVQPYEINNETKPISIQVIFIGGGCWNQIRMTFIKKV